MILRRLKQVFKFIIKPHLKTNVNNILIELSDSRLDDRLYDSKKPLIPVSVDLIIISRNSSKRVKDFFKSLIAQTYPISKINIFAIDNSLTDNTVEVFHECFKEYGSNFNSTQIVTRPYQGFGASLDYAINLGRSKYIFIINVDNNLEENALEKVMHAAENDALNVASWELRQKPYEHLKYYDPVTLETAWSSYTAVLIRRKAYEKVGGFGKEVFMSDEDAQLSYRFRACGYKIKYCPSAVVWNTNQDESKTKTLHCIKRIFNDLYLRLKQGPYIKERYGKFVKTKRIIIKPLVSVIMRTTAKRAFDQLRCSIITVANQTYNNIELVIVEDGGDIHQKNCKQLCNDFKLNYKYYPLAKIGRSAAGNSGLENASGDYLMFLDDDDYLFADHIETIMSHLVNASDCVAAYSLAWEAMVDKESNLFDCKNLEVPTGLLQEYDFKVLKTKNFIPIQSIIFERQLFLERGGFDESLDYLEDWNLWYRYGYLNKFKYIPKITSIYTITHKLSEFISRNQKMRAFYFDAQSKAQARLLEKN